MFAMSALMAAVGNGELENIKRLVAEGADVKEERFLGLTPFLFAAAKGHIPIMHWLLTEGGSSLAERTLDGALSQHWHAWYILSHSVGRETNVAELSSLLKVMVMLEDAPPFLIAKLSPQRADICTRGRQLRAQLPSYLEQQRAAVVTHCPLPGVLQSVVATYAATTPEDMWADGLRVQAPRAKRGRRKAEKEDKEDGENAPPVRRSLRQRQKHA
jgi:hypothetical protein